MPATETRPAEALCQACLRPNPAGPANKGTCAGCGGETCGCQGCRLTLRLLRAGHRASGQLLTRRPLRAWDETNGATF